MSVKHTWFLAVTLTVLTLFGLLLLAEAEAFQQLLEQVPWPLIVCSIFLFQIEGLCTALRIRTLVAPKSRLANALQATGWWVAGLIILPARLGEISGIHMVCRLMDTDAGNAFNSLIMQRLLDALWLLIFGAVILAVQFGLTFDLFPIVSLAILILVTACITGNLPRIFLRLFQSIRSYRRRQLVRVVGRFLLQAARAARRLRGWQVHFQLTVLTVTKWFCGLVALSVVLVALIPYLPYEAAFSIAVLFSLASVLPLQTIGGIGFGDISVAAALGWYGIDMAVAASATVLLRVVLVCAPLTFFLLTVGTSQVMSGLSGKRYAG